MKYGYDKTVHSTEHLHVETGPDGVVRSVWFRCALLPFEQVKIGDERALEMYNSYREISQNRQSRPTRLVGVELLKPGEAPATSNDKFDMLIKKNSELQTSILELESENSRLKDDMEDMARAFTSLRVLADRYSR